MKHKLGYDFGVGVCRLCEKEFIKGNKHQVSCSTYCAGRYWYLNNPEKVQKGIEKRNSKGRRSSLWLELGITEDMYNEMYNKQNGLCAICKKPEKAMTSIYKNKISKLAVDHCHTTGKVRALLCGLCNRGLGYFKDDATLLQTATNYLKVFIDDRPNK